VPRSLKTHRSGPSSVRDSSGAPNFHVPQGCAGGLAADDAEVGLDHLDGYLEMLALIRTKPSTAASGRDTP
jgi:hypothetical protein